MTDEMKLLRALIDALGFDIKATLDFDERKESPSNQELYTRPHINYPHTKGRRLAGSFGQRLDIDEDGNYTSMLINPIIDYKLTKKLSPSESVGWCDLTRAEKVSTLEAELEVINYER